MIGTKIENDTWLIYEDGGDHWKAIRCDKDAFSYTAWLPVTHLANASSRLDGLENTNKMLLGGSGARAWVHQKGGYLPALDELISIVRKQCIINTNSASPIPAAGNAWSSTEYGTSTANSLGLYYGDTNYNYKINSNWCFPIKRIPKIQTTPV